MSTSWFPVSEEVKHWLNLAAEHWSDSSSDLYIERALAAAKDNPDVLIASYRYFFYRNNCEMALQIAAAVLDQVAASEQLPEPWDLLKPILIARKEEPPIRLYLNAYSATGLLLAKLGDVEQAKLISARIGEIDDRNEFGGSLVLDILTNPGDEDD